MTVRWTEKVFNIPPSVYGRHIPYMMHDYLRVEKLFMILFLLFFSFETNKWRIVICFFCCCYVVGEDKQIIFPSFFLGRKSLMSPHVGFMTMWFWVKLHFKSFFCCCSEQRGEKIMKNVSMGFPIILNIKCSSCYPQQKFQWHMVV